jgi:hypothetical protein
LQGTLALAGKGKAGLITLLFLSNFIPVINIPIPAINIPIVIPIVILFDLSFHTVL